MGWIKNMVAKLFGLEVPQEIVDAIKDNYIDLWKAIYANNPDGTLSENLDGWKYVETWTPDGYHKRERYRLGAAKVVCAALAKLVWSEVPTITCDAFSDETLNANGFYRNMKFQIEYFAALGGMAVKVYPGTNEKSVKLDYVTADCFIPLAWDNVSVHDADFLDFRVHDKKRYVRRERHQRQAHGKYKITNQLFQDVGQGTYNREVPLSTIPDFEPMQTEAEIDTGGEPLFWYFRYPVANNKAFDSPMGMSIFGNAIHTIKALDIAFDCLNGEVKNGKRKIIVPQSATRKVVDPLTGKPTRYFDAADEVYQAMDFDDKESMQPVDFAPPLRVPEIVESINALLNILAIQCGFPPGTLTFDGQGIKTATEVVSQNSDTYKSKKTVETELEYGIGKLINAIRIVGKLYNMDVGDENELSIVWDDSIAEDRTDDANFWTNLADRGYITKAYANQKILGMQEEDAKKMVEAAKKEQFVESDAGFGAE